MTPSRRTFIRHAGLAAASTLALPARAEAAPMAPAASALAETEWAQQLAAAEEAAGSQPPAAPWDVSWTAKVVGTHKAMFDVPEIEGGAGVWRAAAWLRAYHQVLRVPREAITQVVVLRHNAIPLVMTHAFWEAYPVGKTLRIRDAKGKKWARRNPVHGGGEPAGEGRGERPTVDALLAGGSIVLGCGTAFGGLVQMVAKQDKLPTEAANAKARSYIIPGIILQPSGIFAGTLAQHHGCCFVRAV
ncbi:MAG: hypothetical protein KJT01_08815 [Gemmatimonadetes bacterium]|nr:hypothetical protein [Gemmatimonadota bacterium]